MIHLPDEVVYIIDTLESAGYEAHAVGGCVRDSLMGKTPMDWDIATSCAPGEVTAIFKEKKRRVLPTGIKHGTVTLFLSGKSFEITTYRVDGEYSDGRRPDGVVFTSELANDLSRRDFTINAMAFSPTRGLTDLFNGVSDLERRIVRCVRTPYDRFSEDYLRMMRAYRFAAVLNFELDADIKDAVSRLGDNITRISAERIRSELDKLLLSGNHPCIREFMEDLGLVLLPEVTRLKSVPQINGYHYLNVYEHTLEVLKYSWKDLDTNAPPGDKLILALCALFHDTGKAAVLTYGADGLTHFRGHAAVSADIALCVMRRLKYDNRTTDRVVSIVAEHNLDTSALDKPAVKRLINRLGFTVTRLLFSFTIADTMGKTELAKAKKLPPLLNAINMIDEITTANEPCTLAGLAVNGGDVINVLGVGGGKVVGDMLAYLLECVIEEPRLNDRDTLIGIMSTMKGEVSSLD